MGLEVIHQEFAGLERRLRCCDATATSTMRVARLQRARRDG